MAVLTAPRKPRRAKHTTVEDLLQSLGGIPAHRVRLTPAPGKATEQDVVKLHDRENRLFELVDGVLVEKPMGLYESAVASVLIQVLGNYVSDHRLGVVAGEGGMMRISTGLVRIPDVSFIHRDRLPGGRTPREPIPSLAPDLAVEVLSESNTEAEMQRKVREYFGAGTRLVWLIDPKAGTARAFTSPTQVTSLSKSGTLDGGDVLPGFQITLADLLDRADGA